MSVNCAPGRRPREERGQENPGGEGWCANTANKRVLVTHPDGRQTVECINNDLGLDLSDPKAIAASLRAQGVDCGDDAVQTVGKLEEDKKADGPKVTKKVVARFFGDYQRRFEGIARFS